MICFNIVVRDETDEYFGLLVGRYVSVVVAASGHVVVRYGETGKTPSAVT